MDISSLVLSAVPLERLKLEQPHLYRDVCEGITKLHTAKYAIDRLPQPYVIDGALSVILEIIDEAMKEVRASRQSGQHPRHR